MIDLNLKPSERQLKQFGVAFLVAGLVVAGVLWWRIGPNLASKILWGVGPVACLVGLVAPRALQPVFIALTLLAFPIGLVIGNVAMALTYYLIVTPIGLVFRLIGRDPLHRKLDREAASYWIERPPQVPAERYFRQF